MAGTPQLLDRYGRPVERAVLREEVSRAEIGGVRSPLTGYPGDGLEPGRLASILREADGGQPLRYLELAETIEERDLHYTGVLATRKRSVAQIDVSVEAASDAPADVEMADRVREWLARDELAEELFDILDAIGKGVSFTEIVWDTSAGQWWPARLEWRDPRWFAFDRTDGTTPLMRGLGGDQPLPPFKFVQAVIRAKSGLPIRSGLARLAAWAWMFKAFTQRDWAVFTQTFGQPVRVGRYGPGASEADRDTLFRAVANIAGDCAAIIPESMAIEFVEAKGTSASVDLYERRADWIDRQVSKAILGQTATTDAIAGGHAVGQEHREVQQDIERADAKALSAILNRDLIRPWVDLEWGPRQKYPRLVIARPEHKNVEEVVSAVERLVPLGLRVQGSVMADLLGLPDPDPGAEVLRGGAAPAPFGPGGMPGAVPPALDPPARTALQAEADVEGALADAAEAATRDATDAMIDAVRGAVAGAGSLEELRARLLALEPEVSEDDFALRMRMALVFAELLGRDAAAAPAAPRG